ncbi:MAG: noncanonical pyrimidine nucleotidase, YjjG family [bacterium]|nr:noncanonical pyrimidine nucleotidase, YjjG family [bacterium]
MTYTTLLLDFDHTLLDSDASEIAAYETTLRKHGISNAADHFAAYKVVNRSLWAAVERGEILPGEVKVRRFELFADELGIDIDTVAMGVDFVEAFALCGDLFPTARDVLEQLAERASLAMVTNGLSEVQRTRIDRLDIEQYFDAIVISAEVGFTKPGPEIFDVTFELLGYPAKTSTVMIGDSLSSDIRGGANYGLATCWYNPTGMTASPDVQITHEVSSLTELIALTP